MGPLLKQVRSRIILTSLVWLLLLGAFIWRCYHLQIRRHDELLEKARERYTTVTKHSGKRGEIYDRDGNLLVSNVPRITISCSPYSAVYEPYVRLEASRRAGVKESLPMRREKRRTLLAAFLAKHFHRPAAEFYEKLAPFVPVRDEKGAIMREADGSPKTRKNQYLLLERGADCGFASAFREQLKKLPLPRPAAGFVFTDIYVRSYPKGRMLANVLGYTNVVNDADVAQSGLEKRLASTIEPDVGQLIYERARDGMPLSYGIQHLKEGGDGHDIFLTVREPIQAILEEELDAACAEWNPDTLYAVIVEPRTGNILALAQRPNFDPNDRSTFTPAGMGVRIATDSYEPGSVMKPFSIGKALDWGFVRPDDKIDCEHGVWIYGGKPLTDRPHAYDMLTVTEVIQNSSNIGTAKIALKLGDDRLNKILKIFHFGERTGLPFALESRGFVPTLSQKDKLAATRVPIGYNIRVSPFQLVRAYCTLANGGRMPQLRLIDRIRDPNSGIEAVVPFKPTIQTFDHPQALTELIEMLIAVTGKHGTARRAAIPGYEVAGKTGTSKKYIPGKGYGDGYFASFVGFVPARDPKLVMLVTFDNPRGPFHSGGIVAAPVFRKTMSRVLRRLNIPPTNPEEIEKKKR